MKKLAVAAAMTLCALSASASNFRGADQVYIPTAGNLQGSSGRFVSDVYVANLTDSEVDISVIYVPLGTAGGTGQEFKNVITLKAFERKEYKNFFSSALGLSSAFGQLIFNGCLKGASCGAETQNEDGVSPNFRAISATSRIYSFNPSAPAPDDTLTTGQLFTGIPWYHFVSSLQATNGLDKVFIQGFRQTGNPGTKGTFRSNIGLVNASQYSSTTMVVTLYQGGMNATTDKKGTYEVQLGPLGNTQVGFSAAFPGVTGENYWVTVEQRNPVAQPGAPSTCVQGCPAFLAYGSVLDNGTGDATTLEATYMSPLSDGAILVIYPSSSGKAGVRRSVRH